MTPNGEIIDLSPALRGKGRKVFFLKKEAKTLSIDVVLAGCARSETDRSFWFFFQKRTASLLRPWTMA